MGNDPGRGGRSDEPQPLATVRRLHLDDVDGSSATATDEWYETERLTGHITGGARSAPTADRPAPSQAAAPVILDWRHASAAPPPTALQRLGRTLAARPRRRGPRDSDVPPARTRGAPVSVLATASQIEPPTIEPEEDEPTADEIRAAASSGPRISLRESVDASGPEHRPHPRLRRAAVVIAVVLSVAAVSVIGIVAETNRAAPKPHPTGLTAATSRPSNAGLNTAAKTVTGALETLAHQADKSHRQRRTVRARRRTRHPTLGRARHSSRHAAINRRQNAPPITTPTTTPSTSGSSSVSPASTSSYGSSSSSPAYSPQPAASESASAAAKSVPLPAGPVGPGGTVGTNCNPKCS
jgi:hypothetical protein